MPQKKQQNAGSRSFSEPAFLVIGKFRRPHGVRGEIPLELFSALVDLLAPECTLYIGENHQPLTIQANRWKQELLLLKFLGLDDRTDVEAFTNQLVYVKPDQLPPLDDGEYYYHQMIGLDVENEDGENLGVLTEILQTGANDVFIIINEDGKETLIPDTEEAVLKIDIKAGRMRVAKMKWYGEGD